MNCQNVRDERTGTWVILPVGVVDVWHGVEALALRLLLVVVAPRRGHTDNWRHHIHDPLPPEYMIFSQH